MRLIRPGFILTMTCKTSHSAEQNRTSISKRIPKVWTCFARGKIKAPMSEGKEPRPSKPLVRAAREEAQRTLVARTSPASVVRVVGTWSRLRAAVKTAVMRLAIRRWLDVQKWEYATVPLISHALQEILNQWGEEGWELVQVMESSATGTTAYLKRPKQA